MFYDLSGRPLNKKEFVQIYEPDYYIGTKTLILPRNRKCSSFVERQSERILSEGLCPQDLPFIIAWKAGYIKHGLSSDKVVYWQDYETKYSVKAPVNSGVFNARPVIEYLEANFVKLKTMAEAKPKQFFDTLFEKKFPNFGPVYILSLLYFFSSGVYPIYDRFADMALVAYKQDVCVGNSIRFRTLNPSQQIQAWEKYESYCERLKQLFGQEYLDRSIDRSLWVYGHAFGKTTFGVCN